MNIIAIEDETLLLNALELAIRTAEPSARITVFNDAEQVLQWADASSADVAFIDIMLPGVNGIYAAQQLTERNPYMNIVFVTSYSSYLYDAFQMHASGYITKPVTAQKVRKELDNLRFPIAKDKVNASTKLQVHCFGNFEVYAQGRPLYCKSNRAIELFAYLIDRRGARCSVGEIEAVIWSRSSRSPSRQSHLRNLVAELSHSLREVDCGDVIIRQYGFLGLDTSLISCDYWDYINNKPGAKELFHGEYMTQYSWAERTLGLLLNV